MVPNGATLVLLPPVTTGSEEDPGAQPDDWTQGLRLPLEGIRGDSFYGVLGVEKRLKHSSKNT